MNRYLISFIVFVALLLPLSLPVQGAKGYVDYKTGKDNTKPKTQKSEGTEMSRKSITEFMERYFGAFSTIAQDPKENHRMAEFFSPDLLVTAYLGDIGEIGREEFLLRNASHPAIQEILTPKEMIIDEAQGMVAALVYIKMVDKATGKLIKDVWFSAHYKLKLDEKKTLKIQRLRLFAQYARPGEKSLFDIYEEEARKLFEKKAE